MIVHAKSGHTLFINKESKVPKNLEKHITDYRGIYAVQNFDANGVEFMYVAVGYNKQDGKGSKEIHVFYPNGHMWSSFGTSYQKAIDGAQADGWMYAHNAR